MTNIVAITMVVRCFKTAVIFKYIILVVLDIDLGLAVNMYCLKL